MILREEKRITGVARPGVYRRLVRTRAEAGVVHADMEDDSHRFGVTVRHDGRKVTAIEGRSIRTPWTLCAEAPGMLPELIGMPLAPSPLAASEYTDQKSQCTHLFDLAAIGISQAARGIAGRDYRVEAPWYVLDATRTLTLYRDDVAVLEWMLDRDRILAPEPYASVGVRPMLGWAKENLAAPDAIEALFIMRRAVLISGSRLMDLDELPTAAATGHGIGACYVHRSDRIALAKRNVGSSRDFTESPDGLLADLAPPDGHRKADGTRSS